LNIAINTKKVLEKKNFTVKKAVDFLLNKHKLSSEKFSVKKLRGYVFEVVLKDSKRRLIFKFLDGKKGRRLSDVHKEDRINSLLSAASYPVRNIIVTDETISPPVVIYNYINGRCGGFFMNELLSASHILKVAADLFSVHNNVYRESFGEVFVAKNKLYTDFDFRNFIVASMSEFIKESSLKENLKNKILDVIYENGRNLCKPKKPCLVHGDITKYNIIWMPNEDPVIIDWAGASFSDPLIDIANLVFYQVLRDNSFSPIINKIIKPYYLDKGFMQNFFFYLGTRFISYGEKGLRLGIDDGLSFINKGIAVINKKDLI